MTTQTIEITNLNQIVEIAKEAADVATDVMTNFDAMKTLRTTALFLLVEKLERLEMTEDQAALNETFQFVYDPECDENDIEMAEKLTFAGLATFQETTGNSLLLNLLFWTHFITEVQEQAATVLRDAKAAGIEGAHGAFAAFRVEANAIVAQLNAFQDRILA
jgi:hypothetical protein